jgi:F0F1-type ATP synthase membrane subunit c/vacuolar-type H+-ATPase subunit K
MNDDETPRPGTLTTRQMVIAFAIIEASVLIPVVLYLIFKR